MADSRVTVTPVVPRASRLLSVQEAISIIDAEPVSPHVVTLPLLSTQRYRLAEAINADRDSPPFDKSLLDGYAVRAVDLLTSPATLTVIGEIAAGTIPRRSVDIGQAIAIMTGAPMPRGADTVVPVELTSRSGDVVTIGQPVKVGNAISRRGSDCAAGEPVLDRGVLMEAAQFAVAASVGATHVRVFDRPRVAVLTTGNEIVPFNYIPEPAQIRNCNGLMLVSLLMRLGCEVTDLGHVPDDPASISKAITKGFAFDAIFVSGGMSMGAYDYVPRILQELGVELKITKVKMKPGKPFVFGRKENEAGYSTPGTSTFVFGLPGNPVSAYICTLRLASRILRRLSGGIVQDKWVSGKLMIGLTVSGPREFYQPAIWTPAAGNKSAANEFAGVTPLNWKGSADIFTLARANCLLVRAENEPTVPKGTLIRVLEIPT